MKLKKIMYSPVQVCVGGGSGLHVGIAWGYGAGLPGLNSRQGKDFFSTASGLALGPTQPHIQWVPGGKAANHPTPSGTDVVELYFYSPTTFSWHVA
jgi:hypothetical protein